MQVTDWTVGNDYLTAQAYSFASGKASGPILNVALPWDLRVAQSPGASSPIVYPPYTANNIIFVLGASTGVTVATVPVGSIDVNLGARAWAQRTSYKDANCNLVHRYVVGSEETAGA